MTKNNLQPRQSERKTKMANECKECRHFKLLWKMDEESRFVCKRYPPTVAEHLSAGYFSYISRRPYVEADDTCGEFEEASK